MAVVFTFFFFQAEDGIRDVAVTGVQTCALPISELSVQLHPGDRILALAQGDNAFVDAHSLSLRDIVQMVRGAPGTLLQLQVVPADTPPNSLPRTVAIVRDQVKFKN